MAVRVRGSAVREPPPRRRRLRGDDPTVRGAERVSTRESPLPRGQHLRHRRPAQQPRAESLEVARVRRGRVRFARVVERSKEAKHARGRDVVDIPAASPDPPQHRRRQRRNHRHVGEVEVHRGVDDGFERDAGRVARAEVRAVPVAEGAVERVRARAAERSGSSSGSSAMAPKRSQERLPGVRPRRRTAREERRAAVGTAPVVASSVGRRRRRVDGVEDLGPPGAAARARERLAARTGGPGFDSEPARRPRASQEVGPAPRPRANERPGLRPPARVRPASPAVAHRG